jgi:hypothetical protein
VQRRGEDLGGEVAEDSEKFHQNEPKPLRELIVLHTISACLQFLAAKSIGFDLECAEERVLLGRDIKHAIEDRHQRDVRECSIGPAPKGGEPLFEGLQQPLRRQAVRRLLHPGGHTSVVFVRVNPHGYHCCSMARGACDCSASIIAPKPPLVVRDT